MRGAAWALAIAGVLGASGWLLLRTRSADGHHLRAELAQAVEQGGIADLGRAQALGRHLILADRGDREAAAGLAFANAMLAIDYGLDTAAETGEALGRVGPGPQAREATAGMAAAARAMMAARAGDRQGAAREAAAAATAAPGLPHPLYALGRVRALAGDLAGAQRALEAAIVGAPGFLAARVAWAEVRLDLGDAKSARSTLETLVAEAPKDVRARLLLDEAEQALGVDRATALDGACPEGRWSAPAVVAGCALARAARARRADARPDARAAAEAAARVVPDEPRLLARTALALAQLGAVDRAAALLARAKRLAAPEVPAVAWAGAAIALGRGRAGSVPEGPRPSDPETRLVIVRAALADGGLGALSRALETLAGTPPGRDADVESLARLTAAPPTATTPTPADGDRDPVRAYVDGLRAHLDGDLAAAARHLEHALSGHGDACRAAGEYVATLRAFKRRPAPSAFTALRAENAACVNLR